MPIKTYRGLLADGGQDTIRLSTGQGKVGYRIRKLELFPHLPGTESVESTVMIWRNEQDSVSTTTATVDFSNAQLLGAAMFHDSSSEGNLNPLYVVFDNVVINQDIFVTHTDTNANIPINYYLELEQIALSDNEATVATVKDMRGAN
mgnify:FL=1